jgi:hypothetical protein
MKRLFMVLSALALASSTAHAVTASKNAGAVKIITQDGVLCYSADVTVNDKSDAALNKQAEAVMLKTFTGLSLSATQYDAADTCDRELIYTFSVDVSGAPTIYNDDLKLHSYVTKDGDVELDSVTAWSNGYWGGDAKVWSRATYTKKMTENLSTMLAQFTADYRSISK